MIRIFFYGPYDKFPGTRGYPLGVVDRHGRAFRAWLVDLKDQADFRRFVQELSLDGHVLVLHGVMKEDTMRSVLDDENRPIEFDFVGDLDSRQRFYRQAKYRP